MTIPDRALRDRAPHRPALVAVCLAALLALPGISWAQGSPTYDDDATRELVARMIEAHGGLEEWWSAPAFEYTMVMYLASLPVGDEMERRYADNWRYYRATVEPRTSRGYVALPTEAGAGIHVAHDGRRFWRRPYGFDVRQFRDGPYQLLYYHYAMISLPWLTQQDGVHVSRGESAGLPGKDGVFEVVELTFDPEGKRHDGFYRLFVDPQTDRLTGWVATTAMPLLPGNVLPAEMDGNAPPTIFRVVDDWVESDGLLIPQVYNSIFVTDEGERLAGTHLIVEPTFRASLRSELLSPPADAEVVSEER